MTELEKLSAELTSRFGIRTPGIDFDSISKYERQWPVLSVDSVFGPLRFFCPSGMSAKRVRDLFVLEPETISWVASLSNFGSPVCFLDVGANMGVYSVLAARMNPTADIIAVEPEFENFRLLVRNVYLNSVVNISPWIIGFSDSNKLDYLYLSRPFVAGASEHSAGDNFTPDLMAGAEGRTRVGVSIVTLDSFVDEARFTPTHIKIDVDGFEHKVISGGLRTLSSPALRSVLIELNGNLAEHRDIVDVLAHYNFAAEKRQVEASRDYIARFWPSHAGYANHIFYRSS